MNIAIFVSGRGSNLQAILNDSELKQIISIIAVVSDKIDCKAFEIARKSGIETYTIGDGDTKINAEQLTKKFLDLDVSLIVLAGYLKLIPDVLIKSFANKMINIHPALLPSFGGKGMYGINVHKAVFNSSAKVSGATVHLVDSTYDTGKIIAQQCVDISDASSPEEIAERVLKIEHKILPEVIKAFALKKIKIGSNRIEIIKE